MRILAVPAMTRLAAVGVLTLAGAVLAPASATASTSLPDFQCSSVTASGTNVTASDCALLSGTPSVGSSVYLGDAAQAFVCILDSFTDDNGPYAVTASDCKKVH